MFGQEGWIIALLTFFMDLHFVSIHSNAEKIFLGEYTAIFTSRLDKNECLFAFMNDRLSFSFSFLLLVSFIKRQGYCFKDELSFSEYSR